MPPGITTKPSGVAATAEVILKKPLELGANEYSIGAPFPDLGKP
jgi:hypothetical protein